MSFRIKGNAQVSGKLKLPSEASQRALTVDANGELTSSNVTSSELGQLAGVTGPIQTQISAKVDSSEKGAANGIATLDGTGKIPAAQLPSAVMEFKGNWNASTNSPSLANGTGDSGDVYRTSVAGTQNLGSGNITFAVGDLVIYNGSVWQRSPASDAPVLSVNGLTGAVVLSKSDIGLGNVDNTSDANKPISTATQTALNGKANTVHTHTLSDLTQSSATNGQVPSWNGTNWVPVTPSPGVTDHTLLTNIGTNTHAQIDTHIGGSSNVHGVGVGNSVVGTGTSQTLTNKTIDADLNTITNIENADIKAGAAIAYSKLALSNSIVNADVATGAAVDRTKLANGTANHVIINNASGTMSSEAALAASRGGLGTSGAAFTGLVKAATGVFSASTLVDADVSASAAIARTKIANGTANHVIINNASGTLTSEAALAASRGGLGTSAAAFTGVVKAATGVFSASTVVDADVSASAAIARSKLANGTLNRILVNNASGAMTDAAAITAARALISDANGIPTHSTVTSTELGHLSGVTSAIQTQLNGKENTITGAATTITSSNLTASRALTSDASGKVAVSTVTSTELGHLSGVTSAIQTQLNAKADNTVAITTAADSGLAGGGTITTSRTLTVDINGTTAKTTPLNSDSILVQESGGNRRSITRANFLSGIAVTSPGDINETSFTLVNNQSTPANVTGFVFANATVRSFEALVSVEVTATSSLFEVFTVRGIQRASEWVISVTSNGDDSLVNFDITSSGQITYTSGSYAGFTTGRIKFRAITLSV